MPDIASTFAPLIPVTLLTGFLGSGKTTVLNKLLRHPGHGRDGGGHQRIRRNRSRPSFGERSSEDLILLNSGCLCCTVRGDLITTLRDLFLRRVRGVIPGIRAAGDRDHRPADPAPILHTILSDPLIAARYRLDGVVTTIDAAHGDATLDRHPEAVKQAAVADRLLLTKGDLVDVVEMRRSKPDWRSSIPARPSWMSSTAWSIRRAV